MQTADKSEFRVGSASDILSGNLKDILPQKEKKVIEVESNCTVSVAAKNCVTIK